MPLDTYNISIFADFTILNEFEIPIFYAIDGNVHSIYTSSILGFKIIASFRFFLKTPPVRFFCCIIKASMHQRQIDQCYFYSVKAIKRKTKLIIS